MFCKFTYLLARREAESYRSQGLHKEALALYTDLLSTSAGIDPALKEAIQTQIREIESEMADFASRREMALTARDLTGISKVWDEKAAERFTLLCTDALCSVGSYGDALSELKKLLRSGGYRNRYVNPIIDCLTGLYTAQQLPMAVEALVKECLPNQAQSLAFQLATALALSRDSDKRRAIAMYRHLHAKGNLPIQVSDHVITALSELEKPCDTGPVTASPQMPEIIAAVTQKDCARHGSPVLARIRSVFMAIAGKNGGLEIAD